MHRETIFVTLSICITIVAASAIIAQGGPLDPPGGPVSSTYKTLDEIEPRIPIRSLPFTITETGSYYLTQSLSGTNGISVGAPGVTLDLMGHTLERTGGQGGTAIEGSDAATGLVVRNGRLVNWGTGVAVEDTGTITVERVRIEECSSNAIIISDRATISHCVIRGSASDAVLAGSDSVVMSTTVEDCFGLGIALGNRSIVRDSIVNNASTCGVDVGHQSVVSSTKVRFCQEAGIRVGDGSKVDDCHVSECVHGVWTGNDCAVSDTVCVNSSGWSYFMANRCTLTDCTATDGGDNGVFVESGCRITDCLLTFNTGDAIRINESALVSGCMIANNGGAGIRNLGAGGSRIDNNTLLDNDDGILTTSPIIILRNTIRGSNPLQPIDSPYGPIVDVQFVGGNGDLSMIPNGDHPWANFLY